MRKDRTIIAVALTISPVKDERGAIVAASTIASDATARKKIESHQTLLLHELSHRVKNTLATVQSITAQTLRASGVAAEARATLEERLIALARAHDVLMEQNSDGADLQQIVSQAMEAFAQSGARGLRPTEGRLRASRWRCRTWRPMAANTGLSLMIPGVQTSRGSCEAGTPSRFPAVAGKWRTTGHCADP